MTKPINGIVFSWKPQGPCRKCNKREATQIWSSEGPMAALHGMYSFWCKQCVLEEQLYYTRKMTEKIPGLEEKLRLEKEKNGE